MDTQFQQVLHDWQPFYQLVGGIAGTLIGLMFIAMSVGTRMVSDDTSPEQLAETDQQIRTFASPTITHLSAVVVIAGVMCMPITDMRVLSVSLGLIGMAGLYYSAFTYRGLMDHHRKRGLQKENWTFHFKLPLACYVALLLTVAGLQAGYRPLPALSWSVIFFVIASIRNSWVTTLYTAGIRR
jgi:hypothetical protein